MTGTNAFTIRPAEPADAHAIAHIQTETWRTTYAGLISADFLANMDVNRRAAVWHNGLTDPNNRNCFFVAEAVGGDVVGFAIGGPERDANPTYKGELMAIYLLDSHQRQGIGRRLVQAVAGWLDAHHYHTMLVWVLAGNAKGIQFYESIGGAYISTKTIHIGGDDLQEQAYGWLDLAPLLGG
ncbi:MAG: GNAT family N-acetyltransferase [Chloroflexi bacterium]|nr:GNAT family N-acetyltransferase [Chloroflexota bacterium]MCC6894789.1 GNAT family N-acetyltransferase [Anaerolineae bacterium]